MGTDYVQMLSKKTENYPVYLDLDTLESYCNYVLCSVDNKFISFSNLLNLKEYIDIMDPHVFQANDAKYLRYMFVKGWLEARLDSGITSKTLILQSLSEKMDPKFREKIGTHILDSYDSERFGKKDIEFMNTNIYQQLNTAFMHDYTKPLTKLIEDVETNTFGTSPDYVDNAIALFQKMLSKLTKVQRRAKQENRFNLTDPNLFNAVMTEACERLLSDSQFLECGMQGLNTMLNGGFENARVYNFIGATGGFKSGLMLNLMKQFQLVNKNRPHKDPTKRPVILFLSQENNIWETILRIFGIYASTKPIKQFNPTEIISMLKNGGFTLVDSKEDIDIEFRYYGNMEIGVQDIKGIVEELDNSGRECICIIQDYIERLKPPNRNVDRRVQLNDVSNELHDLAIDLDLPIITGSQFNKQGVAIIEQMQVNNKNDIGRNVGSNEISESFGMLKNFDVNIGIVIEYCSDEERFYLSFRKLKLRGADDYALDYFLQPFVGKKSKIQLMMDYDTHKVYRRSLYDEIQAEIIDADNKLKNGSRQKKLFSGSFDLEPEYKPIKTSQALLDELIEEAKNRNKNKEEDLKEYDRDLTGMIVLMPFPEAIQRIENWKKGCYEHG